MKHIAKNDNSMSARRRTKTWVLLFVLLIGAAGAFYYFQYVHGNPEVKTTSTAETAQPGYKGGRERPDNGQSQGDSQGGAIDNKGQVPNGTPANDSTITSESGVITVRGLAENNVVKPGDTLQGSVSNKDVSKVQFRIIDEEAGVVAQGSLQVVNGSFSGKLSFKPRSASGRVDIFNFDSAGAEANSIEIPVRFE